ncbi:MAG: alternative ribosome rescue aminoacyl-tRNA hydrolase ArfB [Myxococcota bacterium]|nr:alternative ribosome rescue aminoacyl-tRNA hydrolase ArfB [Myxococcota bacterium]
MQDLEIGPGCVIPAAELTERASRAGGPGGQHVNKTASRVTLRWNVFRTQALGETRRVWLVDRLGARLTRDGDLIVHAQGDRSQYRNRLIARERLADLVAEALRLPRQRRPTRPTRGSRERRLVSKRKRSDVKKGRRPQDPHSD